MYLHGPKRRQNNERDDCCNDFQTEGSHKPEASPGHKCANETNFETVVWNNEDCEVQGVPNKQSLREIQKPYHSAKKQINSLVTNRPVPGCRFKHSRELKSHLLFDREIHDFLLTWRTFRGIDKQNIEGVHPQFNALERCFVATRGGWRQVLIIKEFLFSLSTMWMTGTIEKWIPDSKRHRKKTNRNFSPTNQACDRPDVTGAFLPKDAHEEGGDRRGEVGGADNQEVIGETGGADGDVETMCCKEREEQEECGVVLPLRTKLTDLET